MNFDKKLLLLVLLGLMAMPVVLFAAEVTPLGLALGDIMAKLVIPALGSVLLGVLTALAERLRRKTGIEISQAVIEEAVQYAEAAGNTWLKERGTKMPAEVSQQLAIEYVCEHGGKAVKGASLSHLRHRIDATVQRVFNQDRDYSLDVTSIARAAASHG